MPFKRRYMSELCQSIQLKHQLKLAEYFPEKSEPPNDFRLKWDNFQSCTSSSFRKFRENGELFDVTLCCDNETGTLQPVTLPAHKLILAACSPFFQRILSSVENQKRPFLFLKGVGLDELENLLDFMYNGEVTVSSNSIDKFLTAAKLLEVKGLPYTSKAAEEILENNNSRQGSAPNERHKSETNSSQALSPCKYLLE